MSNHVDSQNIPKFTELNELSSERNGGKVLFATDDWFGEAERLLLEEAPVFKPDLYTEYGKWMDGWETRRKRSPGHDWCIIKLGTPGVIYGIDVDTSFFTGNYAPRFSLQAANLTDKDISLVDEALIPLRNKTSIGTGCTKETYYKVKNLETEKWVELVPMTDLKPGYVDTCHTYVEIKSASSWTHLRLNIYPDGGIARLRVYGEAKPKIKIDKYETIDLVAFKNGGVCKGYSNAHYGHPRNLIRPGNGVSMSDGWETARRMDRPPIIITDESGMLKVSGTEWAIFKLGHIGIISNITVDTRHFKGNYPDSVRIDGILTKPTKKFTNRSMLDLQWIQILSLSKLSPNRVHEFEKDELMEKGPFSHIKITIAPDGGISRVRIFGTIYETILV